MNRTSIPTWLGGVVIVAGVVSRLTAEPAPEVPAPFRFHVEEIYLETDLTAETDQEKSGKKSAPVSTSQLELQPLLGFGAGGSVYHPNLLNYHFNVEFGLNWQSVHQSPGRSTSSTELLQRYHGSLALLSGKPYATSLAADRDESTRSYDFYRTVQVNRERYSVQTGYAAGPVPVSVGATHSEEHELDPVRPTQTTDDTLAVTAHNAHNAGRGNADFNYTYDQFTRVDDHFSTQSGVRQYINLTDHERYGAKDWIQLNSILNYNLLSGTLIPNASLLFDEALQLQHSPRLSTGYEYGLNYNSAGASDSLGHHGRFNVGHRLFDNLTSALDLHGDTTTATSPGSTLDSSSYGIGLNEQYTRHLSTWGVLTLGYSGRYDRQNRQASGQFLPVVNESHVLTDGVTTYLNQPFVQVATVVVTDPSGTLPYQDGLDYQLVAHGPLTEIRRIASLTSRIPNGAAVLVDYTATLQPSANYDVVANALNFRIDFLHNHYGIYGHWSLIDYTGAQQLVLRTTDSKAIGLDTTWQWFHASAEYETSASNLSPYDSYRLSETAQWQPFACANLSLNLDQTWTTFRDTHRNDTLYGAVCRSQFRLPYNVNWFAEGGIHSETGAGFQQEIKSARTGLDWAAGKLTLKLDYQYSTQSHYADMSERHLLTFRVRRSF